MRGGREPARMPLLPAAWVTHLGVVVSRGHQVLDQGVQGGRRGSPIQEGLPGLLAIRGLGGGWARAARGDHVGGAQCPGHACLQ